MTHQEKDQETMTTIDACLCCNEILCVCAPAYRVASRTWQTVEPSTLSAIDLRSEVASLAAQRILVEAYRVHGEANTIEVVYLPEIGRAGVCSGSDSVWTDCDSAADAVARVVDGEGAIVN